MDFLLQNYIAVGTFGLHIDDELTWKSHIDVYNKLVKFIGIFYKLRNKLPQTVLRTVYFAFVHPHIAYGIELFMLIH